MKSSSLLVYIYFDG